MPVTAADPVQLEDIYRQMEERFAENLRQFKKWLPGSYEEIANHSWQYTTVDISDYGLSLIHKEQSYYPEDPLEYSTKQVDNFLLKPNHYTIGIAPPEKSSETLQDHYLWKMFDAADKSDWISHYSYDRNNTPILICYGIASGFHLEILLERMNLRHLIIYEADVELLLASFYCIDWGPIFEHFSHSHRRLDIILGEDIENITDSALRCIRTHSSAFCTQNLIFHHVTSDFYDKLDQRLREKLVVVIQGFGFYDDERDGLEHTLGNVANNYPLYATPLKSKNQLPVFIIGAGPSLQNDIEFIKKNREQAIIISCGSSIGALLSNGIWPDFHTEKERVKAQDFIVKRVERPEDLKQINFIQMNVVTPEMAERFGSCSMMLKSDDFPASLFPDHHPRTKSIQPMAANFGLAFAIQLEFKNIYLFGVDMGMKDPEMHHVAGTVHDLDDVRDLVLYVTPTAYDSDMTTEGNFGGEVFTNSCYLWGVHSVETAAANYHKGKIYNCSDGARMLNTIPVQSGELKLPPRKTSKKEMIKRILDCYQTSEFGMAEIHRALTVTYEQVARICDHIHQIGIREVKNRQELIATIDCINKAVFQNTHYYPTQYLLGATIRVPLAYLYALATENPDAEKCTKIANDCLDYFVEFIQEAKKDLGDVLERHRPQ